MEYAWARVRAGLSCMKALRAFCLVWSVRLDDPTDPYETMKHEAVAKARSQACGSET